MMMRHHHLAFATVGLSTRVFPGDPTYNGNPLVCLRTDARHADGRLGGQRTCLEEEKNTLLAAAVVLFKTKHK